MDILVTALSIVLIIMLLMIFHPKLILNIKFRLVTASIAVLCMIANISAYITLDDNNYLINFFLDLLIILIIFFIIIIIKRNQPKIE